MEAAKVGKLRKEDVPEVHLHASHERALEVVDYKDLKEFGHVGEVPGMVGRQDRSIDPSSTRKEAKHSQEIGSPEQTQGILGSYVNPKPHR